MGHAVPHTECAGYYGRPAGGIYSEQPAHRRLPCPPARPRHNSRMPPHQAARLRLVALWVAVAAHAAAGAAILTLALQTVQGGNSAAYRPGVLASWLALSSAPALILSPLVAALARSPGSRIVLVAAAGAALLAVAWGYWTPNAAWLSVAGLLSLEAAFF